MERQGFRRAAVDRRGHDQRQAHGREDRPGLQPATVHVLDASRAVGVVEQLLNPELRARPSTPSNRREQAELVAVVSSSGRRSRWCPMPKPWPDGSRPIGQRCGSTCRRFSARSVLDDYPLEKLVAVSSIGRRSFMAWELKGKYPQIFDDPTVGAEAQQAVRRRPAAAGADRRRASCCTARGVYGFWPAARWATTSSCSPTNARPTELARFHTLRQQWERKGQTAFHALADFIAPLDSGRADYLGAFAVTTGIGGDELVGRVRGRPRRLQRDHGQGAGRSAGRSLCRSAAQAGPRRMGLRPRANICRPTT